MFVQYKKKYLTVWEWENDVQGGHIIKVIWEHVCIWNSSI